MKKPNNGIPNPDFEIKAKIPLMFFKKKKLTAEEKQKIAIEKIHNKHNNNKISLFNWLFVLLRIEK